MDDDHPQDVMIRVSNVLEFLHRSFAGEYTDDFPESARLGVCDILMACHSSMIYVRQTMEEAGL